MLERCFDEEKKKLTRPSSLRKELQHRQEEPRSMQEAKETNKEEEL